MRGVRHAIDLTYDPLREFVISLEFKDYGRYRLAHVGKRDDRGRYKVVSGADIIFETGRKII